MLRLPLPYLHVLNTPSHVPINPSPLPPGLYARQPKPANNCAAQDHIYPDPNNSPFIPPGPYNPNLYPPTIEPL